MHAASAIRARLTATALAVALLGACATGPTARAPDAESLRAVTDRVAEIALGMRGQPYRWGGEAPGGFDCSGLVQYAYAQAGVTVPRTAHAQYEAIRRLYVHQLTPGDLVFFRTRGRFFVSHVGIYVGENRFVHALNEEQPVHTANLDNPHWQRRLIGAGSLVQ